MSCNAMQSTSCLSMSRSVRNSHHLNHVCWCATGKQMKAQQRTEWQLVAPVHLDRPHSLPSALQTWI